MSKVNFLKKASFVMLAFGVLITGCKKDDEDDKDTNTNAAYNFTPPSSWTAGTAAGGITTYTGPADGGFNPNMNIVTEVFDGTLKQYVDANINGLTIILGINSGSVNRTAFQTTGGLSGEKIVYVYSVSDVNLRFVQYLLSPKSGSKTFVVITGTGLTSYDTKYDATFETAAKSFSWK